RAAPGTGAALAATRRVLPGLGADRFVAPESAAAEELIASGELLRAVREQIGGLR
ncbi:MAG: hypothetical protein JO179_11900, partial [Solirubrobacterales bacterium]|nr:hypothetical protein [Solirubrobacterales bacterium]